MKAITYSFYTKRDVDLVEAFWRACLLHFEVFSSKMSQNWNSGDGILIKTSHMQVTTGFGYYPKQYPVNFACNRD